MATITDVANEAGVSISTVSRVLNKSLLVTDDKREKVMRAVEKVGYEIPRTKIIQTMKNKVILVISTIYIMPLFFGLEKSAEELEYMMIYKFVNSNENAYDQCADMLKLFGNDMVCGVILVNVLSKNDNLKTMFKDLPVVQIGEFHQLDPTYSVFTDDEQAFYEITSLLIQKGRKKIGFATVGREFQFGLARFKGYQRAMRENGLDVLPEYVYPTDYTLEGGRDAAEYFLALDKKPDAICCVSDSIAVMCMKELLRNNIRVPEDIALTGFDGFDIAALTNPGITTVAQAFDEIGEEAVHMMDLIMQGKLTKGRKVIIPHSIVERETT